jgi:hypothetical protein
MHSRFATSAVILLCALLAGCAGTQFTRVADDALVLGQTTEAQVRARLGEPYREGVVTKNNQQMKSLSYAYANTGAEGAADGVVAARSQGFYFRDGRLVGYEFISSWKEDSTDFDGSKAAQIRKGQSRLEDVERLFGRPVGRYIHPMVAGADEQAVSYLYSQTTGGAFNLKFFQKRLLVTANRQGVVTEVDYAESGTR